MDIKKLVLLIAIKKYIKFQNDGALETIKSLLLDEKVELHLYAFESHLHEYRALTFYDYDSPLHETLKLFKQNNYCMVAQDRKKLLEVIQLLIDTGIDIDKKDKFDKTPLQYAMHEHYINEDLSIIKILLENGATLPSTICYVTHDDIQAAHAKDKIIKSELSKREEPHSYIVEDYIVEEDSAKYVVSIFDPYLDYRNIYDTKSSEDKIKGDNATIDRDSFIDIKESQYYEEYSSSILDLLPSEYIDLYNLDQFTTDNISQ